MKSLGIIAEYNPFHQGHKYLIEKAMKVSGADVCISVISGNFVQRGNPAISDKWSRAQTAVDNGVNLVVELPTVYACNSAEYFAMGGVDILEGFGCVDSIAFGSESGNLSELKSIAEFLGGNKSRINERTRTLIRTGISYPKARQQAVREIDSDFDDSLLSEPNNILAVEYLKQIKTMTPYTIKRRGYGYHESASFIREQAIEENPEKFKKINRTYFELVVAKILQTDSDKLGKIMSSDEGLGNKLKNEIRYVTSTEQLIDRIKSKVYTYTRISRLLTQILLDIDENAVHNATGYIRILAFDETGAKFLKEVKNKGCAKYPVITNINKEIAYCPEIKETIYKDILASDMYNIINGRDLYDFSDYIVTPYVKL